MGVGVDNRRVGQSRKPLVFIQTIEDSADFTYFAPENISVEEEWFYSKGCFHNVNVKAILELWVFVAIYRIINGYLVKSSFDPDEYWQSMEVAHVFSFGYGHLTWEWTEMIRGTLHPLLFSIPYSFLSITHLDYAVIVQWVPRFIQAIILSIQDILIYILAIRMFPTVITPKARTIPQRRKSKSRISSFLNPTFPYLLSSPRYIIANLTLLCSLCNWFNWYCGVRTYSNTMEAFLVILGILFWPFPPYLQLHLTSINYPIKIKYQWRRVPALLPYHRNQSLGVIALFFAGFSCVIRPTAAIIWVVLFIHFLISPSPFTSQSHTSQPPPKSDKSKLDFIIDCFVVGAFWLFISIIIDKLVYGEIVVIPWEFVKVNIMQDIGSYYGVHPLHWYFSSAIPTIFFTLLPSLIFGVLLTVQSQFIFKDNDDHFFGGNDLEDLEEMDDDPLLNDDPNNDMMLLDHDDDDDLDDDIISDDDDDDDHHNNTNNAHPITNNNNDVNNHNNNNNNNEQPQPQPQHHQPQHQHHHHHLLHHHRHSNMFLNYLAGDRLQDDFENFGGPMFTLVFNVLLILSLIGHKEFRFLYPLLPLSLPFCGLALHFFLHYFHHVDIFGTIIIFLSRKSKYRMLFILLILCNLPMIIYFSNYHQVGGISVMQYFQQNHVDSKENPITSIEFLMPCHSTPYYSFIHRNLSMSFLDCSPPLHSRLKQSELGGVDVGVGGEYQTEQTRFYADPLVYLHQKYSKGPLPSHFVLFDTLIPSIHVFFEHIHYTECNRFFHSYTPLDDKQGNYVLVYCRDNSS